MVINRLLRRKDIKCRRLSTMAERSKSIQKEARDICLNRTTEGGKGACMMVSGFWTVHV